MCHVVLLGVWLVTRACICTLGYPRLCLTLGYLCLSLTLGACIYL